MQNDVFLDSQVTVEALGFAASMVRTATGRAWQNMQRCTTQLQHCCCLTEAATKDQAEKLCHKNINNKI